MCGRYTNTISIKKLADRFGFKAPKKNWVPRFNIAPGQDAPVVIAQQGRQLDFMHWGLVPSWAKEKSTGYKMINARSETVAQKPSFRGPLRHRRCLVMADGFYEWKVLPGQKKKQPMRITLKNGDPFAMAGLWDIWTGQDKEELHSFTILTTGANASLKGIHDRMPVILARQAEDVWLDPEISDTKVLVQLLKPYAADQVTAYPVSDRVNNPKNDIPQLIEEVKTHG